MQLKKLYLEEIMLYKKMLKMFEEMVSEYKLRTQNQSELKKEIATLSIFKNRPSVKYLKYRLKICEEELKPYKNINMNKLIDQMLLISKKLEELYKLDIEFNSKISSDGKPIKFFQ